MNAISRVDIQKATVAKAIRSMRRTPTGTLKGGGIAWSAEGSVTASADHPSTANTSNDMPPFHYPRFHIFKSADGWHLWWIPAVGCIKMLETRSTFEEALTDIDLLRHKEPP